MNLDKLALRLAWSMILTVAILLTCLGTAYVALSPRAVQSGTIRCTRFTPITVCFDAPPESTPRFWEDTTGGR